MVIKFMLEVSLSSIPLDLEYSMFLANHVFLFNKKSAEVGEEGTHVNGLLKYNFLVFFDWPSDKFKSLEPRRKKNMFILSSLSHHHRAYNGARQCL